MGTDKKDRFKMMSALAAALATTGGGAGPLTVGSGQIQRFSNKPEFTAEELEYIRGLPKRERKKAVAEIKAKYRENK